MFDYHRVYHGIHDGCIMFMLCLDLRTIIQHVQKYPLVRTNIAIEHGPVEIVSFPINDFMIFHSYIYKFIRGYIMRLSILWLYDAYITVILYLYWGHIMVMI